MASRMRSGGRHGHRAAPPTDSSTTLPPLSGQCLCGDFTIVISNPRPGMIMCHCYHCQINSASFFGTYVTTESRKNMMIIQSQRSKKHKPEMRVYDAQPADAPNRCPRTFCSGCGTMLFAEPSSIGVLVVNCGLFQNHKYHPAMKPSLEIFTTRRSTWLTRREDALQADAMPVFPKPEDDTEPEATSRRSSRATGPQWDRPDIDDDADADVDDDEDVEYGQYLSDREDLRKSKTGDVEKLSDSQTPRGETSGIISAPLEQRGTTFPKAEGQGEAWTADETGLNLLAGIGGGVDIPPATEDREVTPPLGKRKHTLPGKHAMPRKSTSPKTTPPRSEGRRPTPPGARGHSRTERSGGGANLPGRYEQLGIEQDHGYAAKGLHPLDVEPGEHSGEEVSEEQGVASRSSSRSLSRHQRYQQQTECMSPTMSTPSPSIR